jgi:hypothetical protein
VAEQRAVNSFYQRKPAVCLLASCENGRIGFELTRTGPNRRQGNLDGELRATARAWVGLRGFTQPLPPKATIHFVALNPQPLPPGGMLDFVAVAAWPAD